MTELDSTIDDVVAVPGVRSVLVLDGDGPMRALGETNARFASLTRGLAQILRRLPAGTRTVALKASTGRFTLAVLGPRRALAIVADASLNVPLVKLALSAVVDAGIGAQQPLASRATASVSDAAALLGTATTAADESADLGRLAEALSVISSAATKRLGRAVVANYWRQTRSAPAAELFEVGQDASMRAIVGAPPATVHGARSLAASWCRAFIARGSQIVVDLGAAITAEVDGLARELVRSDVSGGEGP